MIKKILLGLTLTTGFIMANSTDDLLSLATTGKSVGTNLEMNKTEMEKADGGYYIKGYGDNRINTISRLINVSTPDYSSVGISTADKYFTAINNSNYYNQVGSNFRK